MISRSISDEIKCDVPNQPWPPKPQNLIEVDDPLNRRLFNLVSWKVSPNSYAGKDGFIKLSDGKAVKVKEVCQNIQSLIPSAQPSRSQVLLSMTMYGKTGSKNIFNDLHHLGLGISYTELMFIQDKWAEWSVGQSRTCPSNIKTGVIATHTFDNIDWKNKNINHQESHYTNSILVQKYNLAEELSRVSLDPNYEFDRKKHRSFKGTQMELTPVHFKQGKPMIIDKYSSIPSFSRVESIKSSNKTLLWILARTKSDLKVPSWSGFEEITTDKNVERTIVGYLPPIAESPTKMKVIYAEMERTEKIRVELGTKFIFIEADQAIYTTVLDAMFEMRNDGENMFERIIPRMGGFHITICILRTRYRIHSKIGFVQILAKAGLGEIGSLKRTLKGGDVNEAIHYIEACSKPWFEQKLDISTLNCQMKTV